MHVVIFMYVPSTPAFLDCLTVDTYLMIKTQIHIINKPVRIFYMKSIHNIAFYVICTSPIAIIGRNKYNSTNN